MVAMETQEYPYILGSTAHSEGLTSSRCILHLQGQRSSRGWAGLFPWLCLGVLSLKHLVIAFGPFLEQITTLQVNKPLQA